MGRKREGNCEGLKYLRVARKELGLNISGIERNIGLKRGILLNAMWRKKQTGLESSELLHEYLDKFHAGWRDAFNEEVISNEQLP